MFFQSFSELLNQTFTQSQGKPCCFFKQALMLVQAISWESGILHEEMQTWGAPQC